MPGASLTIKNPEFKDTVDKISLIPATGGGQGMINLEEIFDIQGPLAVIELDSSNSFGLKNSVVKRLNKKSSTALDFG